MFLSIRELTLVMAGKLRHIMFSGWVCLYLKQFFLPPAFLGAETIRGSCMPHLSGATWNLCQRETGFGPGKHVFLCACVPRLSALCRLTHLMLVYYFYWLATHTFSYIVVKKTDPVTCVKKKRQVINSWWKVCCATLCSIKQLHYILQRK